MNVSVKTWVKSGQPWVWLTGGAVALNVIMVAGLLLLIAVRGLGHFWPADILESQYREQDGSSNAIIGEVAGSEKVAAVQLREAGIQVADGVEFVRRDLLKVGNRDLTGSDFRWVTETGLHAVSYPDQLFVAERREWGNFYGYLRQVKQADPRRQFRAGPG